MAFSDFKTLSQVQIEYRIQYEEVNFIHSVPNISVEQFLLELKFNIQMLDAFSSEASRCELIILPVLREAYKQFATQLSLWIQKPLQYDSNLTGIPDYLISKRSALGKTVLEHPVVAVAEAKKNDFEQGWAQCVAELIAAQRLNNNAMLPVYGIVTDGKYWEFGKLMGTVFYKHNVSFVIDHAPEVLGAVMYVLEDVRKNL
jgi:hypothetical protein